ncbi:tRNA N6-adenosine threonylcarbamoyltransferase [uncultured archaeon]|nr:tRNA N6-adenosine threonylcarbamoyltransferase [uncultured archaeon]
MIVVGVEGTAHTFGVGVVDSVGWRILSDVRSTYTPAVGSGILPRDAAQFMGENAGETIRKALVDANVGWSDVDAVAFSQGPGLGPCLRTAATSARALALYHKKPLVGVNHCIAHIEVGRVLAGFKKPLVLYVSGGNSQVIEFNGGRYRVFGETQDIGVGNMLDKFGREVGIQHPAGPKIEVLARDGGKYLPLPYVVKGTDLSFSGILTAALKYHKEGERLEDVCFSLQETAFAMLCEVTERALAHLNAKEVLLTGGVGYNKRLAEMVSLVASEHGAKFANAGKYNGDNGAMIAVVGALMRRAGLETPIDESQVYPNQRTDDVEIVW